MSSSSVQTLGTYRCNCCCGQRVEYTDENCNLGYMRCTGCNCTRVRIGDATTLTLRVQIAGTVTISMLEKATELARLLGAPDDIALSQENSVSFLEIDGRGATSALEIRRLRGDRN